MATTEFSKFAGVVSATFFIEVINRIYNIVKVAQLCLTICDSIDYTVHGISKPEYWNGSLSLLQGIFPTQESNPGILHRGQILYQLSHKGSPRILVWVAYPFSSRSS